MCSSSSPPDYTPVAQANEASARLASEAADKDRAFREQQYADLRPYLTQQLQIGSQTAQQQANIAAQNAQQSKEQYQQYQGVFTPVERQVALDAFGAEYLTPAEREELVSLLSPSMRSVDQYGEVLTPRTEMVRSTSSSTSTKQLPITTEQTGGMESYDQGDGVFAFRPLTRALGLNRDGTPKTQTTTTTTETSTPTTVWDSQRRKIGSLDAVDNAVELARQKRISELAGLAEERAGEASAGSAIADVNSAYARTKEDAERRLMDLGVDPNSGKFISQARGLQIAQAGNEAAAANKARTDTRNQLKALRAGAANLGRNMPNTAAAFSSGAVSAGTNAANAGSPGIVNTTNTSGYVSGATDNQIRAQQLAINANLGLAGLQNQAYGIQSGVDAANAQGAGAAAGAALTAIAI